ncbi:MAG TPA: MFS transporter, partial [Verrucomicrobiae bacterium]|nr:MFS transporter [Verrucomicrobiae bacterium]
RKSLLLFSLISIACYFLVLVWQSWLALLLGSFLFLAWSALSLPATLSVIATSLQSHRHTMGVGVQSMIRRVPMMIGPLIGGWLLTRFGWTDGVRYALALCIVMSLLTLAFQWFMFEPDNNSGRRRGDESQIKNSDRDSSRRLLQTDEMTTISFPGVVKTFTPALHELLVSDILIRFCERIPYAFIILWAMDHGSLTAQQFGYLVTFEMVTAMLCYIPVAHLADKYGRRPFVLITFVFFTLFPVTLLWAHDFKWLALAFVVRGLKEFGEPARKALIIGEAAPELRARTYGAYYLIRDCTVTSGSFLGAWLWSVSPQANFIGAAICGALGTIWFWWFIYRKKN